MRYHGRTPNPTHPRHCITPMSPYFVMALDFMQQYRKRAGIGTLASFTIPIAAVVWVVWCCSSWFGWPPAFRSELATADPSIAAD